MAVSHCSENQGRGCPLCLDATRAALGLAPLHQRDGGHTVNAGVSFPIEHADDQPAVTPERAESWSAYAAFALLALASACAALAYIAFTNH